MKKNSVKQLNELFTAVLSLESVKECRSFFADLCTLAETEAMAERFQVAKMLAGDIPYRTVAAKTGSSTTTVTRVAHWLHHGKGGYRLVLDRLK